MAINGYTGWSSHCNRVILDSTTITIGESATRSSELEQGNKRTALKSMFVPDKYSVVMEFEWEQKDEYGKTELQYFYEWYKYIHKFGTVPFEFPKILYSPSTGIKVYDDKNTSGQVEYYKITSAVEGKKSGTKVQITMTWVSVYGGAISIGNREPSVNFIEATTEYLDIFFSSIGDLIPCLQDFKVFVKGVEVEKKGIYYDGFNTVRIYFDYSSLGNITGSYSVTFSYSYSSETFSYSIEKGKFVTYLTA